jgi:hypothetical protein
MQPQASTSQDALTQLQQAQGGAKSAADILAGSRQQLGVNAAQDTVSGLRGAITNTTKLLNQVAPSVMGRTANSLVTNAQATRQIANEQQPIAQNLSQQSTDYNNAQNDYGRLSQEASDQANAAYGDQQNKVSYLQNLYNSLYGREQDAAKMAEQQRQFNESLTAQKSANAGLAGLFGGNGSTADKVVALDNSAHMVQRGDKGFNFLDNNGQTISAAQYAAATGQSFRDVLTKMANAGDGGAKTALGFVGNDYGYDPTKVTNPNLVNLYNALVGGTNRSASVYNPAPGPAYTPGSSALTRGLGSNLTKGF